MPSPNPAAKATSVLAGMLAGADRIDALDVVRRGGTGRVGAGVRAPSTSGSFLRCFTHGNVQQLATISTPLAAPQRDQPPRLVPARAGSPKTPDTKPHHPRDESPLAKGSSVEQG
ncbi:MAG TPA: hypothetical protein VFI30_02380 [Nocardioidaceae bacterium]|nr:hypothetical protein [Nocardioidaceae bacterium]